MTKGTPSFGKHNKKASHQMCRRCGKRSMHRQKNQCASCGFGKLQKEDHTVGIRPKTSAKDRIKGF